MKRLNIQVGGWPVIGEYLTYLQSGIVEALTGATSNMPDCILSGCVVTLNSGNSYNCTEGYLKWGGEIYKVPAHSFTKSGGHIDVCYITTNDLLTPRLYKDGSQPPIVVNREVMLKGASSVGSGEKSLGAFSNDFTLPTAWQDAINHPGGTLGDSTFYLGANWANGAHFSAGTNEVGWKLRARRFGNFLELDGNCKFTGSLVSTDFDCAILPVFLRPNQRKYFSVIATSDDNPYDLTPAGICVQSSGVMEYAGPVLTNPSISFSGVQIRLN